MAAGVMSRIAASIQDNPILARHLSTTFTGPRLGAAFLLVTAAMVITYSALFTASSFGEPLPGLTYLGHNAVLLGLLILLLPIKVAGIVDGPRLNRSFEQVVVTGASPPLLYLGAWLSGFAYAGLLLFVTVPFAACMVTFGGVEPSKMISGYVTLLAYSNVIIAVSLAISVFGREWFSIPVAILLLSIVSVFAFVPDRDWVRYYPPLLAELSPIRLFLHQAVPGHLDFHPAMRAPDQVFAMWSIPTAIVRPLAWLIVVFVGAVLFVLGPGHVFSPGLDNFGAVVLRGDRKRGVLGRLRGAVTRRVEMGFFYENAPRWTQQWGAAIRFALAIVPVMLALALLIGTVHGGNPRPARPDVFLDDMMMVGIWLGGGILAAWSVQSVSSRAGVDQRLVLGPLVLRRETAVVLLFVILTSLLFWFEYLPLASIVEDHAAGKAAVMGGKPFTQAQLDRYVGGWWHAVSGMLVLLTNLFLIARIASRLCRKEIWGRVVTVLAYVLLIMVPPVVAQLIFQGQLSPTFLPFASLSPIVLASNFRSFTGAPAGHGWETYMTSHGVLFAGLGLMWAFAFLRSRRSRVLPAVAGLLVLSLIAGALPAQDPAEDPTKGFPLRFESVSRGFGGAVFAAGIDFYTVRVHNPGRVPIKAKYWVAEEIADITWGHGEFLLSPGATRRVRLVAPKRSDRDRRMGRFLGSTTRVALRVGDTTMFSDPLGQRSMFRYRNRWQPRQRTKIRTEHYLFVGPRGSFPAAWIKNVHGNSADNLVACPSRDLPAAPEFYEGVEIVWMTAESLAALDRAQRGALHRFVTLGGAVVFYGGLSAVALGGTGAWEETLRPRTTNEVFDEVQLDQVQLIEGRDVLFAAPPASVPLLNLRHVGAGTVAHLAFPPELSSIPASLRAAPAFWGRFDAALPRSNFPLIVNGVIGSNTSPDLFSLFLLGGFYALYGLVLSVGLLWFARRREHRRRVWWQVALVPTLFLCLVPALISVVGQSPSVGEYTEILYCHAGSTKGVVAANLAVHSAGKQSHALALRRRNPLVYLRRDSHSRHSRYWQQSDLATMPRLPVRAETGSYCVDLEIAPWNVAELFVYDSFDLDEPVTGHAVKKGKVVEVEAHVPPSLRERELFAIAVTGNLRGGISFSRAVKPGADGRVKTSIPLKLGQGARSGNRGGILAHRRFTLGDRGVAPVRVFLAVVPLVAPLSELPVESKDIVFEDEIPEYLARGRYAQNVRRSVRQSGQSFIEKLDHRVCLIELSVK